MVRVIAAALLVSIATACSFDNDAGRKPGVQSACFTPTGTPLGCEDMPIETSRDACDKLVACGVVPIDQEEEGAFDYADCVEVIDELESAQHDFALACIEASTCEELASTSTCVEHGEEFP